MRKRYTREQRERLVAEVRSTGDSVSAVAGRLGVVPAAAYHWVKKARAASSPVFARVVPSRLPKGGTSLALEFAGVTIRIEPGFDDELLLAVVSTLRRGT